MHLDEPFAEIIQSLPVNLIVGILSKEKSFNFMKVLPVQSDERFPSPSQ